MLLLKRIFVFIFLFTFIVPSYADVTPEQNNSNDDEYVTRFVDSVNTDLVLYKNGKLIFFYNSSAADIVGLGFCGLMLGVFGAFMILNPDFHRYDDQSFLASIFGVAFGVVPGVIFSNWALDLLNKKINRVPLISFSKDGVYKFGEKLIPWAKICAIEADSQLHFVEGTSHLIKNVLFKGEFGGALCAVSTEYAALPIGVDEFVTIAQHFMEKYNLSAK